MACPMNMEDDEKVPRGLLNMMTSSGVYAVPTVGIEIMKVTFYIPL